MALSDAIVYEKLCFWKCFLSKLKDSVFKFLRFEDRFSDGLVWTVEMKLRFQIPPT